MRRFDVGRCLVVDYPRVTKDLNEVLVAKNVCGGCWTVRCVADDGTTAIFRFWGCAGSRDLFDGMGNSRSAGEDLAEGIWF